MKQGLFRTDKTRPYAQIDKLGRFTNEREELVFDYVLRYAVAHMGHTPTLREIGIEIGIGSTSTISALIQRLVAKDRLRVYDGLIVIPGSSFSWQPRDKNEPGAYPSAHRAVKYSPEPGSGSVAREGELPN